MAEFLQTAEKSSQSGPRLAVDTGTGQPRGSFRPDLENVKTGDTCKDMEPNDSDDTRKGPHRTLLNDIFETVKDTLDWIPKNCTFSNLKPVIRCAIAAWVSLILFLIPRVEKTMGQASFLIVMSAFLSPPSEPFAEVFEKEMLTMFGVIAAWAWSSLAIKLANLARTTSVPDATVPQIFSGRFLEAGPITIFSIFLFFGTAFILYVRARLGSGPSTPATTFACLCVDISLTVAPLYPYPNYAIAKSVVVPIAFHVGVSLAASVLIFPESVNAQFVKRLTAVLVPLASAIKTQNELLRTSPLSKEFDPEPFITKISQAETKLTPLAASARLLKRDFSWGRFSGGDLRDLQVFCRKLTLRAAGMGYFFSVMDTRRSKFSQPHIQTPLPSEPATPADTPRSNTPNASDDENEPSPVDQASVRGDRSSWTGSLPSQHTKRTKPRYRRQHSHHSLFHLPHHHLLKEALNQSKERHPVGVFESQHYMNIEKRFHHPDQKAIEENCLRLLSESVQDLLKEAGDAMDHIVEWSRRANSERLHFRPQKETDQRDDLEAHERMLAKLNKVMREFLSEKRHIILEPYRGVQDPLRRSRQLPPHRFLFRSFMYQYHLLRFCEAVRDMLQDIKHLDKERTQRRLWPPALPLRYIFSWSAWELNESTEKADDEDPDTIPGIAIRSQDLGAAEPRDADALPPSNMVELVGTYIYAFLSGISKGNQQFALKAGILSVLLSLPNYFRNSAAFAYGNKSIWALFIAQLTLARYRGDTIFGFLSRMISTFFGGLVGLVFWYMSSGKGSGNPFGIAAVAAVVFPALSFARIYAPGPSTTVVIFATTVVLIVGYSWQDIHSPSISSQGFGFTISWRRFLLVAIGVTASAIFSFLPPSTTIRRYYRTGLSTTAAEIGFLYCAIVSYANTHKEEDYKDIIANTLALRSKLRRLRDQTANVQYEISLRGKWPTERYRRVLDIQLELSHLLTHFLSVVDRLEQPWSQAFLQRTRFVDSEFLGDVLAVISMISTALRTGAPIPQITPAPLLDRFLRNHPGLNILQQEAAEEAGLPRTVTFDTLQNEQYMYFSVGVSRAHGIVSSLDRLMLATKELVGERFHVDGIRLPSISSNKVEGATRVETTNTVAFTPGSNQGANYVSSSS